MQGQKYLKEMVLGTSSKNLEVCRGLMEHTALSIHKVCMRESIKAMESITVNTCTAGMEHMERNGVGTCLRVS